MSIPLDVYISTITDLNLGNDDMVQLSISFSLIYSTTD